MFVATLSRIADTSARATVYRFSGVDPPPSFVVRPQRASRKRRGEHPRVAVVEILHPNRLLGGHGFDGGPMTKDKDFKHLVRARALTAGPRQPPGPPDPPAA